MTEEGRISTLKNKEQIKTFCDQFCQKIVDGIQEGWIVLLIHLSYSIKKVIFEKEIDRNALPSSLSNTFQIENFCNDWMKKSFSFDDQIPRM